MCKVLCSTRKGVDLDLNVIFSFFQGVCCNTGGHVLCFILIYWASISQKKKKKNIWSTTSEQGSCSGEDLQGARGALAPFLLPKAPLKSNEEDKKKREKNIKRNRRNE